MTPLLVAVAGGLGAATRLVADGVISSRMRGSWPIGTIVINVTGSLALGLVVGLSLDSTTALVLGTGFLGGYTTFSTTAFEVAQRALGGHQRRAAAIATVTLVGTVVAAAAGVWLGSQL